MERTALKRPDMLEGDGMNNLTPEEQKYAKELMERAKSETEDVSEADS